jgi:hypothetical protein
VRWVFHVLIRRNAGLSTGADIPFSAYIHCIFCNCLVRGLRIWYIFTFLVLPLIILPLLWTRSEASKAAKVAWTVVVLVVPVFHVSLHWADSQTRKQARERLSHMTLSDGEHFSWRSTLRDPWHRFELLVLLGWVLFSMVLPAAVAIVCTRHALPRDARIAWAIFLVEFYVWTSLMMLYIWLSWPVLVGWLQLGQRWLEQWM